MSISENIKFYRNEKGLTQQKLADKIGKSINSVKKYESGYTKPPIDVINKIASVLGISINQLIGEKKKTITQKVIEGAMEEGYTIEKLSKDTDIPLNELKCMLENKPGYSLLSFRKLYKFLDVSDEKMAETFMLDSYINCTYNNDGSNPESNMLKKMFFNEPLTLEETLNGVCEEDKDFITQLYYADAFNSSQSNIETPPLNDLMEPINKLIDFLKSDNYPVDKLNNQTLSYIYEKITDLLEFEFYKLEKNNFNITDKKESNITPLPKKEKQIWKEQGKEYLMPIASHDKEGNFTEEDYKHDDDLMNDEDIWK